MMLDARRSIADVVDVAREGWHVTGDTKQRRQGILLQQLSSSSSYTGVETELSNNRLSGEFQPFVVRDFPGLFEHLSVRPCLRADRSRDHGWWPLSPERRKQKEEPAAPPGGIRAGTRLIMHRRHCKKPLLRLLVMSTPWRHHSSDIWHRRKAHGFHDVIAWRIHTSWLTLKSALKTFDLSSFSDVRIGDRSKYTKEIILWLRCERYDLDEFD